MAQKEEDIIIWLVSNKDFRDWATAPDEYRGLYWQNWIEANKDKREALHKAYRFVQDLRFEEKRLSEQELSTMLGNIIANETGVDIEPRRKYNSKTWLKIAASITIFLISGYLLYNSYKDSPHPHTQELQAIELRTMENPKGQKSTIKLPDGSTVYLNVKSKLTFPEQFSDTLREVSLEGEAFFEITKDEKKPFIVSTKELRTEVLGTSFNCRVFDDEPEIRISLVTGKIKIRPNGIDAQEHLLIPGERLIIDKMDRSYVRDSFNYEEDTGWKDGILIFNNADFTEFIKKLKDWYGVEITVINKPQKTWRVNGRFKNETLEEILMGVRFTYDIDYEISGKNVTIKIK